MGDHGRAAEGGQAKRRKDRKSLDTEGENIIESKDDKTDSSVCVETNWYTPGQSLVKSRLPMEKLLIESYFFSSSQGWVSVSP